MFKTEARLFLSAYNKLSCANTLIHRCIGEVAENLASEDGINELIYKCYNDIKDLITKVDAAKSSLMENEKFSSEYMTLLQEFTENSTIDTNMTEAEKMQYSIQMDAYAREYNQILMDMLEKYEKSGMLNDEMKQELEVRRNLAELYRIEDRMATYKSNGDYHFKRQDLEKKAKCEKNLINLSTNLTDDEKAEQIKQIDKYTSIQLSIMTQRSILSDKTPGTYSYYVEENQLLEYEIDYYNFKGNLTNEEKERLNDLKDNITLNKLYIIQEQDKELNCNWPKIEIDIKLGNATEKDIEMYDIHTSAKDVEEKIINQKMKMGIATEDEINWYNMNTFSKIVENTKTLGASTGCGVLHIFEEITDGIVTVLGRLLDRPFIPTATWAEDFVSVNYAEETYDLIASAHLNSVSAYSNWHSVGEWIGETTGTIAILYLPGGVAMKCATNGLRAIGKGTEGALNKGYDFDTASSYGMALGAIEVGATYLTYGEGSKALSDAIDNRLGISSPRTSGLVTKVGTSMGKEYLKEYASISLDGEFDFSAATSEAIKAGVVTTVNTTIVNPLVDKATEQVKTNIAKTEEMQLDTNETKQMMEELGMDKLSEDIGSATYESATTVNITMATKHESNVLIDILDSGIVNKYATKVSSKAIEWAYDEIIYEDN